MVGATLVLRRRQLSSWSEAASDPPIPAIVRNGVLWTVFGLFAVSMDHFAHLGAFVVGTVTAWLMTELRFRSKRSRTYDFHRTSPRGPTSVAPLVRTWVSRSKPCLLGVGFPPLGPRAWTLTSCLNGHARRNPNRRGRPRLREG